MSIYVNSGGTQSGPFDETSVLERLKNGQLSMDDLGIRQGESEWRRLREMFPNAVLPPLQASAFVASPVLVPVNSSDIALLYRKTTIQKIFFGLVFFGLGVAFIGSVVYFMSMRGSSGDLIADLGNMSYRILARDTAIGLFIAAFFSLIAFLLTFKRKIIASNGLRIVLRLFFLFILFIGIIEFGYAAVSFLTYSPPSKTADSKSNEMLKALEDGEAAVGPIKPVAFHVPISIGLMMLGLSGALMTKRNGSEERD